MIADEMWGKFFLFIRMNGCDYFENAFLGLNGSIGIR
jgi:hypothetical protein